MNETVPVDYEVLRFLRVHGAGRLVAMAAVQVDIAGVRLLLQGVQVVRQPDGSLACLAPRFRDLNGSWAAGVVLPPALAEAIAAEVLGMAQGMGRVA